MRNLPFTLTDEWARKRWTGRCELTGIPFVVAGTHGKFFSPSLDRIDPKKGYVDDNCRFILFAVNTLKGVGTDEDMMLVARELIANYKPSTPRSTSDSVPPRP